MIYYDFCCCFKEILLAPLLQTAKFKGLGWVEKAGKWGDKHPPKGARHAELFVLPAAKLLPNTWPTHLQTQDLLSNNRGQCLQPQGGTPSRTSIFSPFLAKGPKSEMKACLITKRCFPSFSLPPNNINIFSTMESQLNAF